MKKIITAIVMIMMLSGVVSAGASANAPDAYMELSVTGNWHIFSKDMEDEQLLEAVDMSASDINKILKDSGSESVIINSETGAEVYVKVLKNDISRELWNIQDTDNTYITDNIDTILSDGFNVSELDFALENLTFRDCAYMKQITVHGSTYYDGEGHGVVVSGTIVNGYAISFMMKTNEIVPSEEEVTEVSELCSGISFTVIKDKSNEPVADDGGETDAFGYILGGFGAIIVIIFCAYMIERIKHKDDDDKKSKVSEQKE